MAKSEAMVSLHDELKSKDVQMSEFIKLGDLDNAETANNDAEVIKAKIGQLEKIEKAQNDRKAYQAQADPNSPPLPGAGKGNGNPLKKSDAQKFASASIETGDSEVDKHRETGGFKSLGHFAYAVRVSERSESTAASLKNWSDIQIKAPTGMFEDADPDGGALVPPGFSTDIYRRLMNGNTIFSRLSPITVSGNTMSLPALKEDSRADGSRNGGVLSYWEGEADQLANSRPKWRSLGLKLKKLTVLTYVTDELMSDSAVALESFLNRVVPDEIDFKITDGIINGNGVGKLLGILNSGSKITVPAVTGQGAGTIVYTNIVKMHNRMLNSWRKNAVFLTNQETEPQLDLLYLPTGTTGVAAFLPPAGAQFDNGEFRLKGKPVLMTEQCQALGTEGDIILWAPDSYASIVKGTVQSAMSMHLRFDYGETAYRWVYRMDGQPYDNVPLSAFKGTNTYSGIVTLSSTRT